MKDTNLIVEMIRDKVFEAFTTCSTQIGKVLNTWQHCKITNIFSRRTNTETMHQKLLQLVTIIQQRSTVKEKWRFVKIIRHLKWSDKKLDEDSHHW